VSQPFDCRKFITIEPGKRSGKPCIRGMRITVQDVLAYLASGMTDQAIIADFRAIYAYTADRERRLKAIPS